MSWAAFKIMTPKGLTSGVLVGNCIQKYAALTIIIPIVFIIVTIKKISILPDRDLLWIVNYIDILWRSFGSQYQEITRVSGVQAADNYLIFFLILVTTFVGLVLHTLNYYKKVRRVMTGPQVADIIALILCLIGGIYATSFDLAKVNPKPLHNFYVDVFGLYYFRQWVAFLATGIAVLLLLIILIKAVDNLLMRARQRSNS